MTRHSSYLSDVFAGVCKLNQTVANVQRALESDKMPAFDAIAVRGTSGITIGSILAFILRKQLIVVRKRGDHSHGECPVEGLPGGKFNYLIIDDFVSTGSTVSNIIHEIEQQRGNKVDCVGCFCYNQNHFGFRSYQELCEQFRYITAQKEKRFAVGYRNLVTDETVYSGIITDTCPKEYCPIY